FTVPADFPACFERLERSRLRRLSDNVGGISNDQHTDVIAPGVQEAGGYLTRLTNQAWRAACGRGNAVEYTHLPGVVKMEADIQQHVGCVDPVSDLDFNRIVHRDTVGHAAVGQNLNPVEPRNLVTGRAGWSRP